jgi:hypothetical protein
MIDGLNGIGRRNEMKMNVGKSKVVRILRELYKLRIMKGQKQQEYFNYFGSMITNDARCTREIESRIVMAKAAFNRKKTIFFNKQIGLKAETTIVLHLERSTL